MKKTGKVVFGVVSAAALVATGYASWSINKGFTQVSSNPISGTVTEILDNSFGKITLKENDTTLVFDAPKEYYNGTEDLEVSYFVKAHANEGEHVAGYDPYDLKRYDLVSQDYRPYLNISAEITDQNGDPLEDETKVANIEKIIDMPTVVIDYHEWLGEEAKNNADGYLVTYALAWDKDNFGGVNPQIVYDNDPTLDVLDKKDMFQEIIDALKGVYFKLTFKVGFYGELPPEVTEEKYGVVTFEEVTNLSLKLTAEGNAVNNGEKLKVGTTVTVEATPSENYHLVSLTHNGKSILDTMSFEVVENENTIAASVEEETTTPDEYTLVGEYNWNPGEGFAASGSVVSVNGNSKPDDFKEYLFSTNTIQDQTEITDFTSVAYCYTDKTFGTIKLGKSGESGILQLTTVNAIKKIEFNAYIWQNKTSSDITVNDISTTMNVESNTDGKATSSVSVELLEGSNIITIESSERIIITNIKLYK